MKTNGSRAQRNSLAFRETGSVTAGQHSIDRQIDILLRIQNIKYCSCRGYQYRTAVLLFPNKHKIHINAWPGQRIALLISQAVQYIRKVVFFFCLLHVHILLNPLLSPVNVHIKEKSIHTNGFVYMVFITSTILSINNILPKVLTNLFIN